MVEDLVYDDLAFNATEFTSSFILGIGVNLFHRYEDSESLNSFESLGFGFGLEIATDILEEPLDSTIYFRETNLDSYPSGTLGFAAGYQAADKTPEYTLRAIKKLEEYGQNIQEFRSSSTENSGGPFQ